jgi:hypothetical protein
VPFARAWGIVVAGEDALDKTHGPGDLACVMFEVGAEHEGGDARRGREQQERGRAIAAFHEQMGASQAKGFGDRSAGPGGGDGLDGGGFVGRLSEGLESSEGLDLVGTAWVSDSG